MREEMFAALKPDLGKIDFWRTQCFPAESGIEAKPIEEILEEWAENKSKLFDMFGQKLIISRPVTFNLSMVDMKKTLNNIFNVGNIGYTFQRELGTALEDFYQLPCRFDEANWSFLASSLPDDDKKILDIVSDSFNVEVLLANSYETLFNVYQKKIPADNPWLKNYKLYNSKTGHTITISESMKPMKLLNKLAKEFEIDSFEEFRLEHSRILNTKKASGNLYLSIHPLDYMTMSDNTNNWSSCMSWEDRGDYCMGTVEMMNSDSVIIAYLTSSSPFCLDWTYNDLEWNNKKWRCLFIVNDTLLAKVKGYPYQYPEAEEYVMNFISSLRPGHYDDWSYEYKKFSTGYFYGCYFPDVDNFIPIDFSTNQMYRDFGHNSKSIIRFSKAYLEDIRQHPFATISALHFCYSGESQCMHCGAFCEDDCVPYRVICNNCAGAVKCCECGDPVDINNIFSDVNGEIYCEECYYNRFVTDELTGEDIDFDDSVKVYFITKNLEKLLISKKLLDKENNRIYIESQDAEILYCPSIRTDRYCLNVEFEREFEVKPSFYNGEYGEKFYYCYVENLPDRTRFRWLNSHTYFIDLTEKHYTDYIKNCFNPWWIRNKDYFLRRIKS